MLGMNEFNYHEHPEIEQDECFWSNVEVGKETLEHFETARYGKVAYGVDGKIVRGLRPCFIKKWEHKMRFGG